MHEHHRASEGDHLGLEVAQEVVESRALTAGTSNSGFAWIINITALSSSCRARSNDVMQPGQVGRIARGVFLVAGGRAAKVVVAADDVKAGEDHVRSRPTARSPGRTQTPDRRSAVGASSFAGPGFDRPDRISSAGTRAVRADRSRHCWRDGNRSTRYRRGRRSTGRLNWLNRSRRLANISSVQSELPFLMSPSWATNERRRSALMSAMTFGEFRVPFGAIGHVANQREREGAIGGAQPGFKMRRENDCERDQHRGAGDRRILSKHASPLAANGGLERLRLRCNGLMARV